MPDIAAVRSFLLDFQQRFCHGLEALDAPHVFRRDEWQYGEGGGGCSCVLRDGAVFDSAGVNFSHVRGAALPSASTALRSELEGRPFEALGVSVVVHPRNPYVPASHANVRLFVVRGTEPLLWWFGGGFDLTPCYGFEADCQDWHRAARKACDALDGEASYRDYKAQCDRYFYLPHRQETRGIGGLFFDDLNRPDFAHGFAFIRAVAECYSSAYKNLVQRRKDHPYGDRERNFLLYRRGRYAEFNLLYDRGTRFGLQSGGRTESILMSLPPQVHWHYDFQPPVGSKEARLAADFLQPQDWFTEP